MAFQPAKNGVCESFQRQPLDTGRQIDLCKRCDRPRSDHASEVVVVTPSPAERMDAIEARLTQIERTLRIHDRSIDFKIGGGG